MDINKLPEWADEYCPTYNLEYEGWEIKLLMECHSASIVFLLFIQTMDLNNTVTISYKELEEQTELSRSTLSKAIKELEDREFIKIVKQGTKNTYIVNGALVAKNYSYDADLLPFYKPIKEKYYKLKRRHNGN